MSHAADVPDPGWPELLPSGRDQGRPDVADAGPDLRQDEPDDDDLFADAEPKRRVTRLTVVLATALLVVAGFAGGAMIGKRSASPTTTAAGAGPARFAGLGGAAGTGPGGAGFGGGFGGGAGGFGAGAGAGTGTGTGAGAGAGTEAGGAAGGAPVVVGTVASIGAGQITVKNFAGATVVVKVPAGTPVTTPGLHGLAKGQTVSVQGTRSSNGTVTATSVVSRS
ncbi:MAG: hypothetical protein ACXV3S_04445 [Kineosporiaceae bacterium]